MADSPLETPCEPQDIGAVNEYPLWRESPEMVCWHRAIREWLGGGGGVEMSGRPAESAHPLEKSAPAFTASSIHRSVGGFRLASGASWVYCVATTECGWVETKIPAPRLGTRGGGSQWYNRPPGGRCDLGGHFCVLCEIKPSTMTKKPSRRSYLV